MSFASGMSWLHHKHQYQQRFDMPVPDWVCVFDLPKRVSLIRTALKIGWRLPETVLICNEFHDGMWSVWGFGAS